MTRPMRELFDETQKDRYAVSAFNVYNYEKLSLEAVSLVTQVAWK